MIVPGFTFVASISAIVYAGATPVLAEVDQSFDLDPADVEAKITPRTRAIIVVHMLGGPARMTELKAVADRHGIPIIEDCAQAFGATYEGRGVGGIGAIGTYSFNEYKTITCGDGGMIVTDDEALYERCFAMHDQGHAPDRLESKYAPRPFLGMNFRMTELSGAVLRAQVRKLPAIVSHLRDEQGDRPGHPRGGAGHRLPDAARSGGRPGDAPRRGPARRAEIAADVAREVGSIQLSESGWHVYSKMNHLLERRTVTGKGCPFDCDRTGPPARRVPRRHAAPDRRAARALDQHRDRRPRREPRPVRAPDARRRGRGAGRRPHVPGRGDQASPMTAGTGR